MNNNRKLKQVLKDCCLNKKDILQKQNYYKNIQASVRRCQIQTNVCYFQI